LAILTEQYLQHVKPLFLKNAFVNSAQNAVSSALMEG
jgi:hypothetical protein